VADGGSCDAAPGDEWLEFHQLAAVIDGIVAEPFTLDEEGMLAVPTGPGLGIELDWTGIERLSGDLD
jgi:L-alanine-DL-glutamate epimerase-like enolase superfamily enzyme